MNYSRGHIPISEPLGGVLSDGLAAIRSSNHGVEELDLLGVRGQGDDGLLALGSVASVHALAAITAADGDGVDLSDLDAEQFFNCLGDVDLGGIGSDLEGVIEQSSERN